MLEPAASLWTENAAGHSGSLTATVDRRLGTSVSALSKVRKVPISRQNDHAPGRTRTCDPRLRRPSLYPAELRGLAVTVNATPRRFTRIGRLLAAATACALASLASPGSPAAARTPARACLVPGTRHSIDQLWRPDMRAAIAYTHHRAGDVAFAVRTRSRFYGYRPDHEEWSASIVKAMLLVTYLDRPSVRDRALRPNEKAVLGPMIRVSDNDGRPADLRHRRPVRPAPAGAAGRHGPDADQSDLGRDRDHRPRPDPVLSQHRPVRRPAAPFLRDCGCCAASPPRTAGVSASWPLEGGSFTSRAAGDTGRVCSTIRWRC